MGDRYPFAPDEPPDDTRFARFVDRLARRLQDLMYLVRVVGCLAAAGLYFWLACWSTVNAVSAGRSIHREVASGRTPTVGEALTTTQGLVVVGAPAGIGVARRRRRDRGQRRDVDGSASRDTDLEDNSAAHANQSGTADSQTSDRAPGVATDKAEMPGGRPSAANGGSRELTDGATTDGDRDVDRVA